MQTTFRNVCSVLFYTTTNFYGCQLLFGKLNEIIFIQNKRHNISVSCLCLFVKKIISRTCWVLLRTRQILLFPFWRVPAPVGCCSAHAKSCFFLFWRVPAPVGCCSAHAKPCFFLFWRVPAPVGCCSAHAKSCFFLFWRVPALFARQQAKLVPPPRSARRQVVGWHLELLTSSASQPPHSYLRASIGSMRAALFAG